MSSKRGGARQRKETNEQALSLWSLPSMSQRQTPMYHRDLTCPHQTLLSLSLFPKTLNELSPALISETQLVP